jgi:molybdopterin adenylyltransferase
VSELKIGIVTSSDSCHDGSREDTAGAALASMCEERGWLVVSYHVCADDCESLVASISEMTDVDRADIVLTCGGTGLGPRDVAPEALALACDRFVPGIGEAIRAQSMEITKRAMLSRASAGMRGHALVINLPGSEKAARECFGFVIDQLEHAVQMARGGGHD